MLRRSIDEAVSASQARKAADDRLRYARERLERLKSYGHLQASAMPIEWRQEVVRDLELYVNETNLPDSLSETDARAFVAARVQQVCDRLQESLESKAKEEADRARIKALLVRASRSANFKTIGWDSDESEDFRQELLDELDEVLDETWNEGRVDRLVESFFQEWLEEVEMESDGGEEDSFDLP